MLINFFYLENYIDVLCVTPNPVGNSVTIKKYGGLNVKVLMLCEVNVIANFTKIDQVQDLSGLVD